MTRPERPDVLRYALEGRRRGEDTTPECLDDDTLAALTEGRLDDVERASAVSHLATCARCRGVTASVARALADPAVAREISGVERAGWRRFARVAQVVAPVAAAAVLLVVVWPRGPNDSAPVHRAPTITASSPPAPMWPVGTVAEARSLRWELVAGADRYRVTLFDASGIVLFETQLADTVVQLPDSVRLVPERPYLWKVEARTGFDRWATSDLIEFSIAGGAPR